MYHAASHVAHCRLQAFSGADIIVHEIGDTVALADLQQKPTAARDDRLVSSYST